MTDYQEHSNTLLGLNRNRYFGKYRGIVIDNTSKTGRLEVEVKDLLDSVRLTAIPCLPYAGINSGFYMMPEPGTSVWVEFEAGYLDSPIWTGCIWGDEDMPENEAGEKGNPSLKIIKSETGLQISLDDAEEVVTISDNSGDNIITIDVGAGKIKIKGTSEVAIDAPSVKLGGEGAFQPVVRGLDLKNYLLALEAWVIPKGPIPPPSAIFNFLSSKVKTH